MTLTDAGPLVALIGEDEPHHARCVAVLDELRLPLLTTWPAFTEAIHLLGKVAGWPGQESLWRLVERGVLTFAQLSDETTARSMDLMRRYKDHPMDLADATLVAVAEARGARTIFSLDGHFAAHRLRGGRHLEVIPVADAVIGF